MSPSLCVLLGVIVLVASTCGYKPPASLTMARRTFIVGAGVTPLLVPYLAGASGGATAGGAYLLSAKQRYNERVTLGAKKFASLSKSPDDVKAIKEYFGNADCYKDFASAGYLLANAFRRSSSTAPDKLPSVQAWKAFAASAEALGKKVRGEGFER